MGEGSSRVDQALVTRGLARSRALARAYVDAGRVRRDGVVVAKASERVGPDDVLELEGEQERWVGRAAYKLVGAFDAFGPRGLSATGRRCLDVGASTGGFTQVLLERGARQVTALDVGHGQLVTQLQEDPRVVERSGTNVREVGADDLGGPFDLVVSDLSFISLRLVLDRLAALATPGGDVVVLVKPQFEVGREVLGRTGVVRSARQRAEVTEAVVDEAARHGLRAHGLVDSPVTGGTGNREYLLWLAARTEGMMSAMDLRAAFDRIAAERADR